MDFLLCQLPANCSQRNVLLGDAVHVARVQQHLAGASGHTHHLQAHVKGQPQSVRPWPPGFDVVPPTQARPGQLDCWEHPSNRRYTGRAGRACVHHRGRAGPLPSAHLAVGAVRLLQGVNGLLVRGVSAASKGAQRRGGG